ncbi:MAG: FHA domain-containing protein [Anaerolineae bacterium]|nr:FHA domain-containing protein [Anaerolineae bacterium]
MTIICRYCEHHNPDGAKICERCHSLLDWSTKTLPPSENVIDTQRFGSTRIERKLYLHVRGYTDPIDITLEDRDFVIGRLDPNSQFLPDVDLSRFDADNMGVSRKHAVFSYVGKTLKIADLQSANGTFLNGYRLIPNQARIVRDGDEIHFGHLSTKVQFGEDTITT